MSKTRHIQQRMSLSDIKQSMMHLIFDASHLANRDTVLDRKAINKALKILETIKKDAIKIREKGGLVVVDCEGTLVTSYALGSYRR